MSILKCKMCGGDLDIQQGSTVAECQYCGSKQTIPVFSDEKKAALYDRAGYYRRNNDFDKAMSIYEQLIAEDNTDAEAHWSAVLCRFGIEYVEDPKTHKRIPTVNRVQYKSILNDPDYINAIENADNEQKELYVNEAQIINQIQDDILAVSKKEDPFDIFICYKETDSQGRRTQDSVIAYDIYKELTKEGYRVFFARVTLEDKLGTVYEPYIFSALNSARLMLVVGTSAENLNAVWVKNEWSRFLSLAKEEDKKTLIPVYKDMNPYDMPEEFSYLQSQDYSKLGALQDISRGVSKLFGKQLLENSEILGSKRHSSSNVATTDSLIKRAQHFVEDSKWDEAKEYYNKVLDIDPESSRAYLLATMVDVKATNERELIEYKGNLSENPNFIKAIRYASGEEKEYIDSLKKTIEEDKKNKAYNRAVELMQSNLEIKVKEAIKLFGEIKDDFEDVSEKIDECSKKLSVLGKKRNKGVKFGIIGLFSIGLIVLFSVLYLKILGPKIQLQRAEKYVENQNYDKAIHLYEKLGKDTEKFQAESLKIEWMIEQDEYDDAIDYFDTLVGNGDDNAFIDKAILGAYYKKAEALYNNKELEEAFVYYEKAIDFADTNEKKMVCCIELIYEYISLDDLDKAQNKIKTLDVNDPSVQEITISLAQAFYDKGEYSRAGEEIKGIGAGKADDLKVEIAYELADSNKNDDLSLTRYLASGVSDKNKTNEIRYLLAETYMKKSDYENAINMYDALEDYEDSHEKLNKCKYAYAKEEGNTVTSRKYLKELIEEDYEDSASFYKEMTKWKIQILCNNNLENNETTDMDRIPKLDYIYSHFKVTGGDGTGLKIKVVGKLPNCNSDSYEFPYDYYDGESGSFYQYFTYGASAGKCTATFYNADTGEKLAETSVALY